MKNISFYTKNQTDTVQLGEKVGRRLEPGRGILFTGNLGAGKTTMISGICKALGYTGPVKSPTFVLSWLYEGIMPIFHVDLYRLGDYEELENIGWEEMTEAPNVYLVEWADRFELPFTGKALQVDMDYGEKINERKIRLSFDENIFPGLEEELRDYVDTGN